MINIIIIEDYFLRIGEEFIIDLILTVIQIIVQLLFIISGKYTGKIYTSAKIETVFL